jgi:hypothetical protein
MLGEALIFLLENIVFWGFVYVIVFMGCDTPAIVFTGFGFFFFYWLFRFVFRKQGLDRMIWLYVVNIILTLMLLYYFFTGKSVQRTIRNGLNSLSKNYPSVEPYVKRC